ncbi:sensor histidine kinase [Profundibacterium mesophilum]|uniref:histidine kinase n=1 Tax=Profundibacterium mesophilum KAUST100406-0324 TaxID=1037889 RepID=A0A921NXP9_9RHOB|nr:sensor histidine kinase [Profundibacterium mesophilum]KAF0677276.1 two-component system chemotaxis family CheBCheR fusion protein [Profundibacterium mesophilum KAUST100406-0324]
MLAPLRGFDGLNRLDVRLVLLLGLALLPIGIIAMVQTYRVIEDSDARLEAALLGETLEAAAVERQVILHTRGAAQSIARIIPGYNEDPKTCSTVLDRYASSITDIAFAAHVSEDGIVRCGSAAVGTDLSSTATHTQYVETGLPFVGATLTARQTEDNLINVVEPVVDGNRPDGYVILSFLHDAIVINPPGNNGGPRPLDTITFNDRGDILSSQIGLETALDRLPVNRALSMLGGNGTGTFEDVDRTGAQRLYTVAPLLPGSIYALSIWEPSAGRTGGLTAMSAVLFPFLMWLISLAVAYFAVHRLVTRHIRSLRQNIRAFSSTRRTLSNVHLDEAPLELREVIEAFVSMTHQIARDEAELENGLHEKDVLLKEVHHRVKNNLQLIASITNMQIRKAQSPETKFVLKRLQDRVLGLATIHRNLYQASVLSNVRADTLIEELTAQITRNSITPAAGIDLELDIAPVSLYPDQAVPLSLLVTEATTNAIKYVGRPTPDAKPWISVVLKAADETGQVRLVISNSIGTPVNALPEGEVPGLGSQLINAFVMQLGAVSQVTETGTQYEINVKFSPSDFTAEDAAA